MACDAYREKELKTLTINLEKGVYRCHTSRACSFVCPKEIDVSHFLALGKEDNF